jgi:hypothetical protein
LFRGHHATSELCLWIRILLRFRWLNRSAYISALAMVLWYRPRLISERSPVWFQLGALQLLSPLFRCHVTDWRHILMLGAIYPPQKSPSHRAQNNTARVNTEKDNMLIPPTWRKKRVLPQQSTGEERIEATKVQVKYSLGETLVTCKQKKTTQYWYHAFRSPRLKKSPDK